MSGANGWIAVDLDGTLARYDGWKGIDHIGAPIPRMVERVKAWLAAGKDVRIFTARVGPRNHPDGWQAAQDERVQAERAIWAWCQEHLGQVLGVTCVKDLSMIELWDDRCVQVVPNTGLTLDEAHCASMKPAHEYHNPDPRPWPGTSDSTKEDDYR